MKRGSVGGLESLDPNLQFGRPMPGTQKTDLDAQVSPVVTPTTTFGKAFSSTQLVSCFFSSCGVGGSGTGGRCWRITGRKELSATTTISTGRGRERTAAATRGKKKGVRGGGEAGWRCNACGVLCTHLLMSTSGFSRMMMGGFLQTLIASRNAAPDSVEQLWRHCGAMWRHVSYPLVGATRSILEFEKICKRESVKRERGAGLAMASSTSPRPYRPYRPVPYPQCIPVAPRHP